MSCLCVYSHFMKVTVVLACCEARSLVSSLLVRMVVFYEGDNFLACVGSVPREIDSGLLRQSYLC